MADDLRRVGLVFTEKGAVDFKKSLQEVNLELNKNYNEFKLVQAQWNESTTKVQKLREQQEYLTNAYEIQKDKVSTLKMQLSDLENSENKNTTAIKKKRAELLNAETQLKNYENRLKTTTTNLKNAEAGILTTAEKLEILNKEIKENESRFKLAQSQYTAMTTKTQKLQTEEKYLTEAYNLQNQKLTLLKQKLQELQAVEDKNAIAISEARNEVIKAETELNNYSTRLKIVSNELNNLSAKAIVFGDTMQKVGAKIQSAGKKLSAFSVASGVALALSAKSAIDFESAFTGVEKTVDGTEEQLAELKQGIRDMAKELPSSTTEISAVAEAAGQLGIKTENILGFSKAMIDLGNSTNLTAEEAASSLAKFANIMQMSQNDFYRLGSSIVDLGNNFATTEADIVEMSMRIAGAGKQVGLSEGQILGLATALSSVGIEAEMGGSAISKAMVKMQNAVELGGGKLENFMKTYGFSLEELELMAANQSKAFKEMAQEIGMTSTELKNMVTAGVNLRDFAKVSGMSAEEFKKAWKEDASGALTAFIKGLGDAESKGESAITMLSEMGLTEVRLRDALLRAANSGELFNKAIETGTKAWEDNTALTNEANKRYGTLKSQIQIAINKIKDLAITFGNKLTPTISKVIKQIEKMAKWVENLTDEQAGWILKISGAVVALGPFLTILGKITSTAGGTIKAIGTFTQAIGVVKGTVTTTSTAVNGLANIIGSLTSPAGIATIAITTLAGTFTYLALKQTEQQKVAKELSKEMTEQKQSIEEYNKSVDDATNANLSQINSVSKLKNELKTLVDENGKVKEGYKSRVDFILNQLNEALGTEFKLNGDVIESYKKLQDEIDDTIEKKRAQIILQADEEKYTEAIQKQKEAVEKLKSVQDELGMSIDEAKQKYTELTESLKEYEKSGEIYNSNYINLGKEKQALGDLINAYNDGEKAVQIYTDNVKQYENDYALYTEGKYEEIYNSVVGKVQQMSDTTTQELKTSIEEQQKNLQAYQEQVANTGNEVAQEYATQSEQNLDKLVDELYKRTSTIEVLGQDEIEAWKQVATNSYNKYSEKMKEIPSETRKKIEEATGVVVSDTNLSIASGKLAEKVTVSFDNKADGEKSGKNFVSGVKAGLANQSEVQGAINASGSLGSKILNKFKDILGIHSPSKEAEEAAKYFLEGFVVGVTGNEQKALKSVGKLANDVNDELNDNLNESDYNGKFKGNGNTRKNDYNQIANSIVQATNDSNRKIIDLLTKILEKSGTQVVLDTGVLVGETAPMMDVELNNIQSRKERGS